MNAVITEPLRGEILDSQSSVRVIASLHPLKAERSEHFVPAGLSIAEIIASLPKPRMAVKLLASIDGDPIPRDLHSKVRPKAGHTVTLIAVPQGGSGGMPTILMIVVAIAALAITAGAAMPLLGGSFAAGALGAKVLAAAVAIAGGMLTSAKMPARRAALGRPE